jgi:hypothetical protein
LGRNKEIELLGNILLNDKNNKCRAWATSSFMQISFRKKLDIEKVLPHLYNSIQTEEDCFVIENVINTLQVITKKKFGLNKIYCSAHPIPGASSGVLRARLHGPFGTGRKKLEDFNS